MTAHGRTFSLGDPRTGLVLGALFVCGLLARIVQLAVEPAYLHPDAIYQAIEPAYRLVWGHGERAWEQREGARSVLFPWVLAAPMALTKALQLAGGEAGMQAAIDAARGMVVAIDLVGAVAWTRIAWREGGPFAAVLVAFIVLLHPVFVVTAASPLIDVPAAALVAWLVELGTRPLLPERAALARRAMWVGGLTALALIVRIQLLPALCVWVVGWAWQLLRRVEHPLGARTCVWLAGAFGMGVVVLGGVLDAVTLGAPFHALRTYLAYNLGPGQTAYGVMPWDRYLVHGLAAMPGVAPVLTLGMLLGLRRWPWLAASLAVFFVSHQVVPYKVFRFLHPALGGWTVLGVLGVVVPLRAWQRGGRSQGVAVRRWVGHLVSTAWVAMLVVGTALAWLRGSPWSTTWLVNQGGTEAVVRSRALTRAYLAISTLPRPDAVVQSVLPGEAAPGRAWLGSDVPVFHVLSGDLARSRPQGRVYGIVFGEVDFPPQAIELWHDDASSARVVEIGPVHSTMSRGPSEPPAPM